MRYSSVISDNCDDDVMDKVLEDIKCIALRCKNINKAVLFGSRARGDNTEKAITTLWCMENGINPTLITAV